MKVKVEDIKINSVYELRITSGKDISQLKESIEQIDLLHPIIIDENNDVVAGHRRFRAVKELGWSEVEVVKKEGLTFYEKYTVALHENMRRKNLSPYETSVAISIAKEIYEEEHPETKHGASLKIKERDSKGRITKKTKVAKSVSLGKSDKPPVKRYTQAAAEFYGVKESTIKDYVQIGDAIRQNKITEEIQEKLKRRDVAKSKVLSDIRVERIAAKKTPRKPPRKLAQLEYIETPVHFCFKCQNSVSSICPMCQERVLICDKKGVLSIKDYVNIACDNYEE